LKRLNPEKLSVEFRPGVTPTEPVMPRRYTLTHSDETGELFLAVGLEYALEKIGPMRDEVLAEWRYDNCQYIFAAGVYVDGEFGPAVSAIRDQIFRGELPLALEAIRYGDRVFFLVHPELDAALVWIYFQSVNPEYNRVEYWGTMEDYR
jgi:hypothetical protein